MRRLLIGTEQVLIVWEDSSVISQVFPEFNLEDKVALVGGVLIGLQIMRIEGRVKKEKWQPN